MILLPEYWQQELLLLSPQDGRLRCDRSVRHWALGTAYPVRPLPIGVL
jgi:hypothetical protein